MPPLNEYPPSHWAPEDDPVLQLFSGLAGTPLGRPAMGLFRVNDVFQLESRLRGAGALLWPDRVNRRFPGLEGNPWDRVWDLKTTPHLVATVEPTDVPLHGGRIIAVREGWRIRYGLEFEGGVGRLLLCHTLRRSESELSLRCLDALAQARRIFLDESGPLAGVSIRFTEAGDHARG